MFKSRSQQCQSCGATVDRKNPSDHRCLPDRRIDYEMSRLSDEIADLEPAIHRYLSTAEGRFESWVAARELRSRA